MVKASHVNYVTQGNGPPVILIHGLASSWHDWTYLMPALASRGLAVYALDLPGHGDSAKPEDPDQYQIEQIYHHLAGWLDSLSFSDPLILVGHSLGGYLSLLHAIRQPRRVERLVLIDPFYERSQLSLFLKLVSRQPQWGERARRIVPQWMVNQIIRWHPDLARHAPPEVRQQMAADYGRTAPGAAYLTRGLSDLSANLSQVTAPTLVIWGEHDQTLHPASFPRLVTAIAGASGHPIPKTSHHPHLSRPAQVNRLVLEFIEKPA